MSKHYTTVDGLFGSKIHYDENGNYAGTSVPGLIEGSMIHYDANGSYAGTSMPGLFQDQMLHTDATGLPIGTSSPGLFGTQVFNGVNGSTGVTTEGLFGTSLTDLSDDLFPDDDPFSDPDDSF